MTRVLHIVASPRRTASKSNSLASSYVAAKCRADLSATVDTLDLWHEPLPEFDGNSAAAKMTFFGDGKLEGAKKTAWDEIVQITQRFIDADHYVIAVPMWNGGIPYKLKQYIDIVTQPGLLFGFDPTDGYNGLLCGKRATIIYSSGVYAPGVATKYGVDYHSTYLEWWLRFIGVDDIETIRFQPSLLTADPAGAFEEAHVRAGELAA